MSYQPVLVQPLCDNNPFSLLETKLVPVVRVTVVLCHNNHQGLGGKEGKGKDGEGKGGRREGWRGERRERGKEGEGKKETRGRERECEEDGERRGEKGREG